jgi:hypothetical protein
MRDVVIGYVREMVDYLERQLAWLVTRRMAK